MATAVSGVTGLAGRYATALFELAVEGKQIDQVADDLAALSLLLGESDDLQRLVRSPVLSRDEQQRAMVAILSHAGAATLTRNFVGLLAARRRLFVLADIIDTFNQLLAAHRGEVRAAVISAHALSQTQLDALRATLKTVLGGEVAIDAQVDQEMIGGLVVRVGSRMVDASLRTKIQRLQLAMKGVG